MSKVYRRSVLTLGGVAMLASCASEPREHFSLLWERLPDLPKPLGGQMAGIHNGALLVAGGSYFNTPPWEGGPKIWVDAVFVLTHPAASWQTFHLPAAFGYAASASTREGLLLIGGGDSSANRSQVLRLRWTGRSIEIEEAAPLPVPLANAGAAVLGSKAYLTGGQQLPVATQASKALYSLDLSSPDAIWNEEAPLPSAGRILPSVAATSTHLYVAGGASLSADDAGKPVRTYLRDAWRFSPASGWEALPAPPRNAVAAASFALGSHFLMFGGDDGRYASQPELRERHPGFPREVLAFDATAQSWQVLPAMPAGLVTTTATFWNGRIVVPGGEDRPAHRSAEVHTCVVSGSDR